MRDYYDECLDGQWIYDLFISIAVQNSSRDGFLYTRTHARFYNHRTVEWTIFFVVFFFSLLSKVNKRSLRDNIVRVISVRTWTWRQRNKEVEKICKKEMKTNCRMKEVEGKKIINACIKCWRYLCYAIKQCVWQLNRIVRNRKKIWNDTKRHNILR